MAHGDVEVEIKIPLDKESFLKAKEKAQEVAVFLKNSFQSDTYYSPFHRDFLSEEFPFEWLRIGKRGDKVILNYKNWHPNHAAVHTHCDEFDVVVDDSVRLEKLFSALNFKKLVTVEKQRESFVFNGEFEISFDSVSELGFFVEIESLKDFGDIDLTHKKMFELAELLGIDASSPDQRGYPYSLMEKKGLL